MPRHWIDDDLVVPHLIGALVGALIAIVAFIGYLWGKYFPQKVAILAVFAGLVMATMHATLLVNQGWTTRDPNDTMVQWALYLGGGFIFVLVAGINSLVLITHDYAKIVELIVAAAVMGAAAAGALSDNITGHWLFLIVAGAFQLFAWFIGFANAFRRDMIGWAFMIFNVIARAAFFIGWIFGPEMFHMYGHTLYAWLAFIFFGLYIVVPAIAGWVFVQDEEAYQCRHKLAIHEHHESTADGVPLNLNPMGPA